MWLAEGRSKLEWSQTSVILAMLYNANRDPKNGQPASPADFNPYRQPAAQRQQDDYLPIEALGAAWGVSPPKKG